MTQLTFSQECQMDPPTNQPTNYLISDYFLETWGYGKELENVLCNVCMVSPEDIRPTRKSFCTWTPGLTLALMP